MRGAVSSDAGMKAEATDTDLGRVDKLAGFRILGEIGSGGTSVVYEAIQESLARRVAIKVLKPNIVQDPIFVRRFEHEARVTAALQHENIMQVVDFIDTTNTPYIVMEYVDGVDLRDVLKRGSKMPVVVAAIIALRVAQALNHAHFRGVVHRDIKPANIMISVVGDVKLMDFGIARQQARQSEEVGTKSGVDLNSGLGTPSYMSPEQISGTGLDFRSDVFSLGIVLYEMLSGERPFRSDEFRSVSDRISYDDYHRVRHHRQEVPRVLQRIVDRCLRKEPSQRYQSTQALVNDLQEFVLARVTTHRNAALVMYLRDIGVLTTEQVNASLPEHSQPNALQFVPPQSWWRRLLQKYQRNGS